MSSVASQLEKALRLHRAGDLAAATRLYREILRQEPNQSDALNLLGLVHQHQGDHVQAVDCFTKAATANPKSPAILLHWAISLRATGAQQKAIDVLTRAAALDARNAEVHHQLGNALKSLGRFSEAATSLRQAAELNPAGPLIKLNLGVALLELGHRDDAIACFRHAIEREPAMPEARNILGAALIDAGRLGDAATQLREALRLKPGYAAAHDNLGRVFRAQGRAAEAIAEFRAALAGQPLPATHSNLVYALNFVPGLAPAEIYTEHYHWAQLHAAGLRPAPAARKTPHDFNPERRLRIGFVSPDFIHHAVAYFFEPLLGALDRREFEVFCYNNAPVADAVTARLKALSDPWRDIAPLGDDAVAELIASDKIDILFDLAGHTARNRLLVFARKPAPVQVTWLGYPNTTGLDAIDYRITDAVCDPQGKTETWHSEKLLRLPGTFSCYRPSPRAPEVMAPPAHASGLVTFGSFNHFAKINPEVLALWAEVMVKVPRSRLLLKARSMADPGTAQTVLEIFGRLGIDAARIELRSDELSVADQLGVYSSVDIALDPFPYNGTTTTCEALWMGVPVVTLAGAAHVSRVSASLLTSLDRPEWIAYSKDEYVEKCATLAAAPDRLAEIRLAQRERMRLSPLCDETRFAANFQIACRAIWRERCAAGSTSVSTPS